MIELDFYGAASTVTGSNYLVKTKNATFIVDCGMFQGEEVESYNLEDFDYDPKEVDFVLLTHAHIDHSGMLPKLYKHGFRGPIYATNQTIQITELLLLDSAKIQENNYQRGQFYGKYTNIVAIVYDTADAEDTIDLFRAVNFNEEIEPAEGIKVKFIKAGHVLGAASIEVDIMDEGEEKKVLFSGDIGRTKEAFIDTFDTEYDVDPDYILVESLYGGVEHPSRDESVDKLLDIINATLKRGGNVFIPSFSVQRTQDLLYFIRIAKEEGILDKNIPVYLDSPLAQKVTNIYTQALQTDEFNPFHSDNLTFVRRHKDSMKLTNKTGQIILAGSGMADGGRILNHLATGLKKQKNAVAFVGFQAEGTIGRLLVEGAESVIIDKTKIPVNADIHYLRGFSAHGDTSDYIDWIERFKSAKLKKVFLIHADEERAKAMKDSLKTIDITNTHIPKLKESVKL